MVLAVNADTIALFSPLLLIFRCMKYCLVRYGRHGTPPLLSIYRIIGGPLVLFHFTTLPSTTKSIDTLYFKLSGLDICVYAYLWFQAIASVFSVIPITSICLSL